MPVFTIGRTEPHLKPGVIIWILLALQIPGDDSAYERGGDARRKFWIKPLKETNLGVVQIIIFGNEKTKSENDSFGNANF